MKIEVIETRKGALSRCRFEEGTKIARISDFLDAMASSCRRSRTIGGG
jgi:hypothetical protein